MIQIQEEERKSKVILVGVNQQGDLEFDHSMEELKSLAEACDMEPVARMDQNVSEMNHTYYVGKGKVEEIGERAKSLEAEYIIFNNSLSPSQLRNLQKEIPAALLDRTSLILEIFKRRAKTREAKMQVEMAELQYMLPRLSGMGTTLSRQGGASGSLSSKGAGEKKLELDRRKIEKRISELRRALEEIDRDKDTQRKRRNTSSLPKVALVGYTNGGKSTLMNKMLEFCSQKEEKMVMAKDMLFATLDTTVRKICPGENKDSLLSDTVGFVSSLPHHLIQAFQSTLDEVRYADLLLHVVDFSNVHYKEQMRVTRETLEELGAGMIPTIYVMNKADKVMDKEDIPKIVENKIYMSVKEGKGLEQLLHIIQEKAYASYIDTCFFIPYSCGGIVSYLNENAQVKSQEYASKGVKMDVRCHEKDYRKYGEYVVK